MWIARSAFITIFMCAPFLKTAKTQNCIQDSNRCFAIISDHRQDWFPSEKYCADNFANGHLASIRNVFETNFITKLNNFHLLTTDLWTGGFRTDDRYAFQWSDGSTFNYTNFAPGQPHINGYCIEICVIDESCRPGEWKAGPCDVLSSSFICEYATATTSTSAVSTTFELRTSTQSSCDNPPPTQIPPYPCQANIILLLDASNGTNATQFSQQKQFINDELLDNTWTFSQLAIGAYDNNDPHNFQAISTTFGSITNLFEARGLVESANQLPDTANIATGLQKTLSAFTGQQPCVKQVNIIFASTSDPRDVAAALPYARQLQRLGPVIFVAMGHNVNPIYFLHLATPGAVVTLPNFSNTTGVAEKILLAFDCFSGV